MSFSNVTVADTATALCSASHAPQTLRVKVPASGVVIYVGESDATTSSPDRVLPGKSQTIDVEKNCIAYAIVGTGLTQAVEVESVPNARLRVPKLTVPSSKTTYTQTYSTGQTTVPNATYTAPADPTASAHTYPGSGNMFSAAAADLLINVRTDSIANAVADIVVNEKSLADNLNQDIADRAATITSLAALAADVLALKKVVTQVIDDLQAAKIAL